MGQHHILLDESKGEYIDMGKRVYDPHDRGSGFYQMPAHAIVRFIHSRDVGSTLKITTDSSADDYAYENSEVDSWDKYCQ